MGAEVHLWRVDDHDKLIQIGPKPLDLESRIQEWLERDISILDPGLLVIGRQVETDFGGFIDILCIDAEGDLAIVELKRDKTPREVTAQALDYASWVTDLSPDQVAAIANDPPAVDLQSAFKDKFGAELPDDVNEKHRILVVGSKIDQSSERIMRYLSDSYGVNINAATFQYFQQPDGAELLARVFLLEPSEVERKTRTGGSSKPRQNLTFNELEDLADEHGVRDRYEHAVSAFQQVLYMQRTKSSLAFTGVFPDGRRGVVISVLPGHSNAGDGLHYQIYQSRFEQLAGLSSSEFEHLLPAQHEPWEYAGSTDPYWQGFQGFIKSDKEIDGLAGALREARSEDTDA